MALMFALGVLFDEKVVVNVTAAGVDISIDLLQVPLRDLKALQQLLIGLCIHAEGTIVRCTVSIIIMFLIK